MKGITVLLLLIQYILFIGCYANKRSDILSAVAIEKQDSLLLTECLARFVQKKNLPPDSLFAAIALGFIDAPYLAGTLEKGTTEKLIVNLREFDCTTLVETCLALQKTILSNTPTIEGYLSCLQKIRYRNGSINGYSSRLHYFSEWIAANEKSGHLHDITCRFNQQPRIKKINFMSRHARAYRQLAEDSVLVREISGIEERISNLEGCLIPKEEVSTHYNQFEDGMIIGITTNIEGLDFVHAGILIRKKERVYLLHASSEQAKVCLTPVPLHEYLLANKRQTGIVVLNTGGKY